MNAVRFRASQSPLLRAIATFATVTAAALLGAGIMAREPDSGALSSIAPMHEPRFAHTATTLRDGRVLIVGGTAPSSATDMASELFDSKSQKFAAAGPMVTPRKGHSATLLFDGRVLIAGGYDDNGDYLRSAELYDPATGKFTSAGQMTTARADHVAVDLLDGTVLLVGGVGTGWTFLASAELYDPVSERFRPTGTMHMPRESHAVVRLADGRVLVVGGHQGRRADIQLYASAEIYNPSTKAFSNAGNMGIKRHKHEAALLADGRVLITGGADERDSRGVYKSAEIFDAGTNLFHATGDMNIGRYKHRGTAVMLNDARIFLAGGASRAEIFDPISHSFTTVSGAANLSGQFSASARLHDGSVLITGGYGNGESATAGAWLYQNAARE